MQKRDSTGDAGVDEKVDTTKRLKVEPNVSVKSDSAVPKEPTDQKIRNNEVPQKSGITKSPPKAIATVRTILASLASGDIVPALGLKTGDRLQVLWELEQDDESEEKGQGELDTNTDEDINEHWWNCTLSRKCSKKHKLVDGKSKADIAVYELRYEPLEENDNYAEYNNILQWRVNSRDQVNRNVSSFVRNPVIADAIKRFARENDIEAFARKKFDASDNEIFPIPHGQTRQASEQLVNAILANVVSTHIALMNKLPASTQFSMADKVAQVKCILIQKIAHCLETKKILDAAAVREIIEEMMPDLRKLQET